MFVRDTRAAAGVATASHFSMESGCVGVPGGSPRRDGRERRPYTRFHRLGQHRFRSSESVFEPFRIV
jgi:hypothetical protein